MLDFSGPIFFWEILCDWGSVTPHTHTHKYEIGWLDVSCNSRAANVLDSASSRVQENEISRTEPNNNVIFILVTATRLISNQTPGHFKTWLQHSNQPTNQQTNQSTNQSIQHPGIQKPNHPYSYSYVIFASSTSPSPMRSQVPVYPTVQCRDQQIESPLPVACHRWGRLSQEPATGSGMLVLCWSPHRWRRYIWIISYMRTYTYIYIYHFTQSKTNSLNTN